MMLNKILILDDKADYEDFSTTRMITLLNEEQKLLIDYYRDSVALWSVVENGDDVQLIKDFNLYEYVFIHDSFDSPLIDGGLMPVLIKKLSLTSNVVLFSGGKQESNIPKKNFVDESIELGVWYYEILRRQYFNNLPNFLNSWIFMGSWDIKYLYDQYRNPKRERCYELFDQFKVKFEESHLSAIDSKPFQDLFALLGENNIDSIRQRYISLSDDEIIENMEDLIESF